MGEHIEFMRFNIQSRRLDPDQYTVSRYDLMDLQVDAEHGVIFGHYDYAETLYVDRKFVVRTVGDGGKDDPARRALPAS